MYSLLVRVGVKCENHLCTIEFIKHFFSEYFKEANILTKFLEARKKAQYYETEKVKDSVFLSMKEQAPIIMQKCEQILERIKEDDILNIRQQIQNI